MGAQGRENRAGVSAQEYPQRERNLAAEVEDTAPQTEHPEEEVEEGDRRAIADLPVAPEARPTGGAQGSGHQAYDEPLEGSGNAELEEACT